jgi:hypothetical protein
MAWGLCRFAFGVRRFCREPLSVEAARLAVLERMATRDQALLALLDRAIFANPRSPYLALMRAAGLGPDDVRNLVKRGGVEGALEYLRQDGVYVSFEEYKGFEPAVRRGRTLRFRPGDFDNPLVRANVPTTSGGTRARPSRILIDLDDIEMTSAYWALWFDTHGWHGRPVVFVTPEYPGIVTRQLRCAKIGMPYRRWFATGSGGSTAYLSVSTLVHWLARRATGVPRAERVPLTEAGRIGDALAGMLDAGPPPCVVSSPSTAARICVATGERGRSLPGVTFLLGGEPFTEARRIAIAAAGAVGVPNYGTSETGPIGAQCPHATAPDEVHVYLDGMAVRTDPRTLADDRRVEVLSLTSLRPASPRVLLNTDIGDHARVEVRRCACGFDGLGYHTRLSAIRSSEKLTGEGVTILGSDLYRLVEDVLPRAFGGAVGDYQVVERQDPHGRPAYALLVSPRVGKIDEDAVLRRLLDELRILRPPYRFMVDQWIQSGAFQVRRAPPVVSGRGKVLAFRTLDTGGAGVGS